MSEWFYLYCAAYQYALAHPEDPERWRFCDEALVLRPSLPEPAATDEELEARPEEQVTA